MLTGPRPDSPLVSSPPGFSGLNKVLSPAFYEKDTRTGLPTGLVFDEQGNDLSVVTATTDTMGGVRTFSSSTEIPSASIHPAYWCHYYAGSLVPTDDTVVTDMTGNSNHATRGANLSAGQLWATANYVSVLGPLTGTLESVLAVPAMEFDYMAGESLLLFWRGKAAAPGGTVSMMGDYTGTGLQIRGYASGAIDAHMVGTGSSVLSFASQPVLDGTLHDFAAYFDGASRTAYSFVDGVLTATATSFGSALVNTKTSSIWYIGSRGYRLNATGMDSSTRSLAMLRWPVGATMPSIATVTSAVKRLRENPGRLLSISDL